MLFTNQLSPSNTADFYLFFIFDWKIIIPFKCCCKWVTFIFGRGSDWKFRNILHHLHHISLLFYSKLQQLACMCFNTSYQAVPSLALQSSKDNLEIQYVHTRAWLQNSFWVNKTTFSFSFFQKFHTFPFNFNTAQFRLMNSIRMLRIYKYLQNIFSKTNLKKHNATLQFHWA